MKVQKTKEFKVWVVMSGETPICDDWDSAVLRVFYPRCVARAEAGMYSAKARPARLIVDLAGKG